MKKYHIIFALVSFIALSFQPSWAQESRYTDTFNDGCTEVSQYELGATWRCEAWGLYYDVAEGDLRFSLSFGVPSLDAPEAHWRSFGNFNSLGKKIEWRFARGADQPFAAINRYLLDRQLPDGTPARPHEVLTIYKVAVGAGSCHVAYVDASLNADANEIARKAADSLAAQFDCRRDVARYYGKTNKQTPIPPQNPQ